MYKTFSIFLIAFFAISFTNAQGTKHVNSKDFLALINSGNGIILDVRTPQEYSQGHIENSTLISTNDRNFVQKVSLLQKGKPIYVYCLTGSRSRAVTNYLSRNGYTKIYNLSRGIMEWQRYGYSLVKSSKPIASNNKTYSQTEFNTILKSTNLVLIDFHATWCAPCKQMSPIIEQLKNDYKGKATIEKIDITSNKTIKDYYKIQSIPGLVLFKNGKEVWRNIGLISHADLNNTIKKYL